MLGKRSSTIREGESTAKVLVDAAKSGSTERVSKLILGPETSDEGLQSALVIFIHVAHDNPDVIDLVRESWEGLPEFCDTAFASGLACARLGNASGFEGGTANGQAIFLAVIARAIALSPGAMSDMEALRSNFFDGILALLALAAFTGKVLSVLGATFENMASGTWRNGVFEVSTVVLLISLNWMVFRHFGRRRMRVESRWKAVGSAASWLWLGVVSWLIVNFLVVRALSALGISSDLVAYVALILGTLSAALVPSLVWLPIWTLILYMRRGNDEEIAGAVEVGENDSGHRAPVLRPGQGVPPAVKRALENELDFLEDEEPLRMRWTPLGEGKFIHVDRETKILWLNSQYRESVLKGSRAGVNDAPLLKALLFLLFEEVFRGDTYGPEDTDKVALWQEVLVAAADAEGQVR